jgi:hypothetical protein
MCFALLRTIKASFHKKNLCKPTVVIRVNIQKRVLLAGLVRTIWRISGSFVTSASVGEDAHALAGCSNPAGLPLTYAKARLCSVSFPRKLLRPKVLKKDNRSLSQAFI